MARIEYFYSAHSVYAYLGAPFLYDICARHGATLVHRPMLLGPVMEAAGGLSFRDRPKAQLAYFFGREIQRWAEWRGLPIIGHRPTTHDAPYDLANRLIIAAQAEGAGADALSFALLQRHWRDDADLSDPAFLRACVTDCGLDADHLFDCADSPDIIAQHGANTDDAIAMPVFGSPTYVVDGDPFYGQDRLDLVERAVIRPFARPGN
ncbi:MAG: 2-hydroxychromene-2-carboxylate isomerase [Proteobacteria bacterium]|nr:2-hydroxychromene-2-carboxylate isomerase [Pseudomonadota bacterium]